jgi:type IV secretion system protein VirD4
MGIIFLLLIVGGGIWLLRRRKPEPSAPSTAHGSARFANYEELNAYGLLGGVGYPLGLWFGAANGGAMVPNPLRYSGDRHRLICAPTRSGKFVACVGPLLLNDVDSSALVVDIKGEAAAITGEWRKQTGPIHVLDPWGLSGHVTASFNPLDLLKPDSPDLAEDASMLADALVVEGAEVDRHWNEEAKGFLTALMLHVACDPGETNKTLTRVREIMTLDPEELGKVLAVMAKSDKAQGLVKRGAARFTQKQDKESSGVISTAQQQTHFLDSPRLKASLAKSSFDFADLKKHLCTIYLVLPAERVSTFNRWLRLLISVALTTLQRTPGKPTEPIKFIVDEFPALGAGLKVVEAGIGLMAGFGVQFHIIVQDFNQLNDTYGNRWQSFVANTGILQVFGVRDLFTAEYISKLTGDSTVRVVGESYNEITKEQKWKGFKGMGVSYNDVHRLLLTPGEVMTLQEHVQLIFPANGNPILLRKHRWFEEQPWAARGKNPPDIFKPLLPVRAPVFVRGGETYALGDGNGVAGVSVARGPTPKTEIQSGVESKPAGDPQTPK